MCTIKIITIWLLASILKQTNDGNGILTGETQLKAMEQPQQYRHQHPLHQWRTPIGIRANQATSKMVITA